MNERIDHSTLAEMTAEIVSAYVSHNRVAPSDVPTVISSVAARLGKLGQEEEVPAKREPAVPVRRSISKDHITCLICGRRHKLLKRHLAVAHGMTPAEYREAFELKPDYPMTAPSYVQQRSDIAMQIGLGRAKRTRGRPRKTATKRKSA